mgnify:CR=1 FL=1
MQSPPRPLFLNLLRLRLTITGWVSILHRLSGALLFVALPLLVWIFARTLTDESEFARVAGYLASPIPKLLILVLVGAFALHFVAGLRHLAMDAHWGISLNSARRSSAIVMLTAGAVVLLAAWVLFR